MMSQLGQLAGFAAGLSILTSFLVVIVLTLGAYALILAIKILRTRLERDSAGQAGDVPR